MIDSGLLDENDNGHGNDNDYNSDDMFDGIIDILDFSMEDMVIDGEVEELQGESSPLGDLSALPCPFMGNSCNDLQTPCLLSDETPQTEPIIIDTCSGNISLHGDSWDDKVSLQLQNSRTSGSGKSASEPFAETIEASEGCSNSMKGKQKRKKRKKLSLLSGGMRVKKQWWQQPITIGRCMHCNVTRTPQWREGPNGPKTLCNACGVCYKRGSLCPEYRPASSPTFIASLHTNSRRKVTEMRHKAGQAAAAAAVGASPTFLTRSLQSDSHDKIIKISSKDGKAENSCSKAVEMRSKGIHIQVGAAFLAKSDSKTDEKVTPLVSIANSDSRTSPPPHRKVTQIRSNGGPEAATSTTPIFIANSDSKTWPPSHRKVTEIRSNGGREAATATTPTFVASLHSNSHKKCSFQQPVTVRKCMHCEATETPLWRQGPGGPKSLCNACGIRYKSGRLFPEYHPAASPTFVAFLHSNSHKKVLEMRNQAAHAQQQL